MGNAESWKTVSVRLRASGIGLLNQRLSQCGFDTIGQFVKAFLDGAITNRHLVDPLAEVLAAKMVYNMSTSKLQPEDSIPFL